jgi:hypothetical protein
MKHIRFINFLRNIFIFATILILISLLIFYFIIPQYYLPIFPFLFLLFLIVNSAFSFLMVVSAKKRNVIVIRSFLLGWTLKLFLYVLFLIIYVILDKANAVNFLLQFACIYIAFSGFEIASLIRNFKKQDDPVKN